jgi:hypothetical protein
MRSYKVRFASFLSFPRKREYRHSKMLWTPVFAGVMVFDIFYWAIKVTFSIHFIPTNSGTDRAQGWKTIDRLFCPVSLRARGGFFQNP